MLTAHGIRSKMTSSKLQGVFYNLGVLGFHEQTELVSDVCP